MKNLNTIFLLLLFLGFSRMISLAQEYEWSTSFNSPKDAVVRGVAVDNSENSGIAIIDFYGDLTLDSRVYNSYGDLDGLIVKYKSNGDTAWTCHFGSDSTDFPRDVGVDNDGNIFVTGSFCDSANFQGTYLRSVDKEDIFLAKLSSGGTLLWVKNIGWGKGTDRGNDLLIDADGHIHIAGWFTDSLIYDNDTLVTNGFENNFIAEFDENGNYLYNMHFISTNSNSRINSISSAIDGGSLLSGFFTDTIRFIDSIPQSYEYISRSKDSADIILIRIYPNKEVAWVRTAGGTNEDQGLDARSDPEGNIYLCGFFRTTASFDSTASQQSTSFVSNSDNDAFVAKYNSQGRLLWKTRDGGPGNDLSRRMNVYQDLVHYTGHFSDTIVHGTDSLMSAGLNDTGFGVRNTDGDFISYAQGKGNHTDRGMGIAITQFGSIYLGGFYKSNEFILGNDTLDNSKPNKKEGFLAKAGWPISLSVTKHKNVTCNGDSDGELVVTPYFGDPPFNYDWSHNVDLHDSTATGLGIGNYTVIVTDGIGEKDTVTAEITQPQLISIDRIITNVNCFNGNDGAIDVMVSGGTDGYTYIWTSTDGSGHKTSDEDQTGLTKGTYNVEVEDANGCTVDSSFMVTEPSELIIDSISKTDVTTGGAGNGTAQVHVSGGTIPYHYVWSNGDTTASISGLDGGTYTVTVTDNNGCIDDDQVIINEPGVLFAAGEVVNVSCYDSADARITIIASGGVRPYIYSWSHDAGLTDSVATDLSPGFYQCIVTDDGGGKDTVTANITQPEQLLINISITDVTCNGYADGKIDLTRTGGTPAFSYLWSTGDTTENLIDIGPGTYSVTVTDGNGCKKIGNAVVIEPSILTTNLNPDSVSCSGGNNGSIDLTTNGGTEPYSYLWSNTFTTEDIDFLFAGQYWVKVTDDNGCIKYDTTIVEEPDLLVALITDVKSSCFGRSDGSATATATGGTTPFSYLWNDPESQTSATAVDLTPNSSYTVTVTDYNGCTADTNIYIDESSQILILVDSSTDVTCSGYDDGTIYVTISGGTAPYDKLWSNADTSEDILGIPGGDYSLTVTDANNCPGSSGTITIEDNTVPIIIHKNVIEDDISCFGLADGTIVLRASGGIGNLEYSINDGSFYQSDTLFSSVTAGDHITVVRDANGCFEYGDTLNVYEPNELVISSVDSTDITCSGLDNGTITITAAGGTGTLDYSIDSGKTYVTDTSFADLPDATYYIFVKDDNECKVSGGTATIIDPPAINVSAIDSTDVTVYGGKDGTITISATGGTGTLEYSVDSGKTWVTNNLITGLTAGIYHVYVKDVNLCEIYGGTATINQPSAIEINSVEATDVSCNGKKDGTITITATGTDMLEYSVDSGQTYVANEGIFTGLVPGTYNVFAKDESETSVSGGSVLISEPTAVEINTSEYNSIACYGDADGSITITATGGTTPYTYTLNPGAIEINSTGIFTNLSPGSYSIDVNDNNLCGPVTSDLIEITQPDSITVDSLDITDEIPGNLDGSIFIQASGGTPPYTYTLNPGSITDASGLFENLAAGSYTVTITDANICSKNKPVEVGVGSDIITIFNAFTPNGDGVNEVWNIRNIGLYPDNIVRVYNTWGNLVFSSEGYKEPWDGTFNGHPLPADTYFYVIDLGDGSEPYTGSVNIIK